MNLTLKDIDELKHIVNSSDEIHVTRRKVKAWIFATNLRESPRQQIMILSEGMGVKGHTYKTYFYIARKPGKSTHPYSLFHINTGVKIADFAETFYMVTEAVRDVSSIGSWDFDGGDIPPGRLLEAGRILSGYNIKVKNDK